MSTIATGLIDLAPGVHAWEALAPQGCSAAKITITRDNQPPGPLYLWRVYERDGQRVPRRRRRAARVLRPLANGDEVGCVGYFRDGTPGAPLGITVRWPDDEDRDLIRLELEVLQPFRTSVRLEWL